MPEVSLVADSPQSNKIVLRNVRVFDGHDFIGPQTVVVDGALIGSNPEGANETIDGQGGFLLPGFIDAHVHLHHEDHLRQLLSFGVTSALDMATWPAEKMNALRYKRGLPDIRSAGLPATAPGSIHTCALPLPSEALLSGPDEAENFVQKRIAEGSDYVKIISDVPGPTQETLTALTAAAHKRAKMVVAHASAFVPFEMALKAGADVITHTPRDKVLSTDMVDHMVAHKIIAVPTLTMMEATSARPSISAVLKLIISKPSLFMALAKAKSSAKGEKTYENAKDSVTAMYRAGVPILAGTDCHEEADEVFSVKHGVSFHRELELLVEAGISTTDAIRAATVLPAQHFNLPDRGAITEGKRADLVLLRDDPIKNISASRSISHVWCGGLECRNVAKK